MAMEVSHQEMLAWSAFATALLASEHNSHENVDHLYRCLELFGPASKLWHSTRSYISERDISRERLSLNRHHQLPVAFYPDCFDSSIDSFIGWIYPERGPHETIQKFITAMDIVASTLDNYYLSTFIHALDFGYILGDLDEFMSKRSKGESDKASTPAGHVALIANIISLSVGYVNVDAGLKVILSIFRQGLLEGFDHLTFGPHNIASIAYLAMENSRSDYGASQHAEALLTLWYPGLFKQKSSLPLVEEVFQIASLASISKIVASNTLDISARPWLTKLRGIIVSRLGLNLQYSLSMTMSSSIANALAVIVDEECEKINPEHILRFLETVVEQIPLADTQDVASFTNLVLVCRGKYNNVEFTTLQQKIESYIQPYFTDKRNTQDGDEQTALHKAAKHGSIGLKVLVNTSADVQVQDRKERTALYKAAKKGSIEELKVLVNASVDVQAKDKEGRTALHSAATYGFIEGLKILIDAGADVQAQDKEGRTALHNAANNRSIEGLKILIDAGADVQAQDKEGRTALHNAAKNGSIEGLKALVNAGADVQAQDKEGQTALHEAAKHRSSEKWLKMLVDAGADVNTQDKEGRTALHEVVKYWSDEKWLKMLVNASADVNTQDKEGRTALHNAAKHRSSEKWLKMLVDAGADVQAQDKEGRTALHEAAKYGSMERLKVLVNAGADVNTQDREGRAPLHEAMKKGAESPLDLLKDLQALTLSDQGNVSGAEVNLRDLNDKTALHEAANGYSSTNCKLLLSKGANVNAVSKSNTSALHEAVSRGSVIVMRLLVESKADLMLKDANGRSPLDIATAKGKRAIWDIISYAEMGQITEGPKRENDFIIVSKALKNGLKYGILEHLTQYTSTSQPTESSYPRLRTFPRSVDARSPTHSEILELEAKVAKFNTDASGWAVMRAQVGISKERAIPAVVIVHPSPSKLWGSLKDALGELQYVVESGSVKRSTIKREYLQQYHKIPPNGSSVGNRELKDLSGSLGGYVKLPNEEQSLLSMTCAHVLIRDIGIRGQIVCVQPSNLHWSQKLQNLENAAREQVNNDERSRIQREITCHMFKKSLSLGSVPIDKDGRMMNLGIKYVTLDGNYKYSRSVDWALVKIDQQRIEQPPITRKECGRKITWGCIDIIIENHEPRIGKWQRLYMQGATTGSSEGVLSPDFVCGVITGNTRATRELAIFDGDKGGPFSAAGDSGSWVIDEDRKVVGMIFAGTEGTSVLSISLMMRVQDILSDIGEFMKESIEPCAVYNSIAI